MSKLPRWAYASIILFLVYFPAAYLLQKSYRPPSPDARHQLVPPFISTGSGLSYIAYDHWFFRPKDVDDKSQILLFEDDKSLGPITSEDDVYGLGHGRYARVQDGNGAKFVFSSSDGTNPAVNGRRYWVARSNLRP